MKHLILRSCSMLLLTLVATLSTSSASAQESQAVLNGIDVLVKNNFDVLQGKRVGLITNHTGTDRDGRSTVEILKNAPGVELVVLFGPEHGFSGQYDVANIKDSKDPTTGLRIYSLYGKTRKPTKEHLEGVDTLIFDIQDIGCRFYTYIATLGHAMEAAAEHNIEIVVLDRVNPIGGLAQGPMRDLDTEAFVAYHTIPLRHGMTIGELALMFNKERDINAKLKVVPIEGWQRDQLFDQTGLIWINPSPNMRGLTQALLYPGVGLLEFTNLSVGRGTDTPFEVIGAPWMDGRKLQQHLFKAKVPGVTFVPVRFTPSSSKFQNEVCEGLNIIITNRDEFDPIVLGFELANALRTVHKDQWQMKNYATLLHSKQILKSIADGVPTAEILAAEAQGLEEFKARREAFLLYK